MGVFAYRSLAEEIRRETHRTLTVIAEQKTQQIEELLDEIPHDSRVNFSGHSQLETLFAQWLSSGRRSEPLLAQMQAVAREGVRVKGSQGLAAVDAQGRTAFVPPPGRPHAARRPDCQTSCAAPAHRTGRPAPHRARPGALRCARAHRPRPAEARWVWPTLSWRADETLYPLVSAWAPCPPARQKRYLVRREEAQVRFVSPLRHHPQARALPDRGPEHPHPAAQTGRARRARHPVRRSASAARCPCWPMHRPCRAPPG